jgi:hypothetical protein
VLGRKGAAEGDGAAPVREDLYRFDASGAQAQTPWRVTDAQSDDSIGRYRVGLGTVAGGEDLAVSWTVAQGRDAGVWTRRLGGASAGAATRLVGRAAWGSEVARDGSGVVYREGGELGAPVRLFYAPWNVREPFALGAGWDPATAFVRGRVLVAGVVLEGADGAAQDTLVAVSQPGAPARALPAPQDAAASLAGATDSDLAATRDGAWLAWIEPVVTATAAQNAQGADGMRDAQGAQRALTEEGASAPAHEPDAEEGSRRRLAVARVVCY